MPRRCFSAWARPKPRFTTFPSTRCISTKWARWIPSATSSAPAIGFDLLDIGAVYCSPDQRRQRNGEDGARHPSRSCSSHFRTSHGKADLRARPEPGTNHAHRRSHRHYACRRIWRAAADACDRERIWRGRLRFPRTCQRAASADRRIQRRGGIHHGRGARSQH